MTHFHVTVELDYSGDAFINDIREGRLYRNICVEDC